MTHSATAQHMHSTCTDEATKNYTKNTKSTHSTARDTKFHTRNVALLLRLVLLIVSDKLAPATMDTMAPANAERSVATLLRTLSRWIIPVSTVSSRTPGGNAKYSSPLPLRQDGM